MGYHSLSTDSGGTPEDRRNEADRVLDLFREEHVLGKLSAKEKEFVDKLARGYPVSVPQLFYLRDIKDRYL